MKAQQIISELQAKGARFELNGEGFNINAPQGLITAELKEELTELKPEILLYLTRSESQIEALLIAGLDCPYCSKPIEVITHPLDDEIWLHCIDPECIIMTLRHDNCEWCRDCGQKLTMIAGRCMECLLRVLLASNESCVTCGSQRFWRQAATAERPAGYTWRCAICHEPPENAVYFELPGLTEGN